MTSLYTKVRTAPPSRWTTQVRRCRLRCDTFDATGTAGQSSGVDQELVTYFDRRFSELKSELELDLESELVPEIRAEIASSAAELRAEIAASAAETRRHFDVVADQLLDKIQLVGEGVITVDQKLDQFRSEVGEELRRVDRRLLRLEAPIIG
jgi:hypothetical protein